MKNKIIFQQGKAGHKVPINPDIYRKNLEYYSGMGIYPEDTCKEKALLVSGYKVVNDHNFDNI